MQKTRSLATLLVFIGLTFIVSCQRGAKNTETKSYFKTYPCLAGLKTDAAWIVLEWNGKPVYGGYGSGFLIDKEKGLFLTNKHVSDLFDLLGKGSHKIFFNCRVYNAKVIGTSVLADAALVRITDLFDFSDFPNPKPFAGEKIKVGDYVVVEGYHLHPYWVRESDEAEGYKFPVVPIFRDYYNLGTKDLDVEREVVLETLDGVVVAVNEKVKIEGQGSGITQNVRESANIYIRAKTIKNHKFEFQGLSGSVVRNRKGETIGILTASPKVEYDPGTKIKLPDGSFLAKRVFKTFLVTPISSVRDLLENDRPH